MDKENIVTEPVRVATAGMTHRAENSDDVYARLGPHMWSFSPDDTMSFEDAKKCRPPDGSTFTVFGQDAENIPYGGLMYWETDIPGVFVISSFFRHILCDTVIETDDGPQESLYADASASFLGTYINRPGEADCFYLPQVNEPPLEGSRGFLIEDKHTDIMYEMISQHGRQHYEYENY